MAKVGGRRHYLAKIHNKKRRRHHQRRLEHHNNIYRLGTQLEKSLEKSRGKGV
jgi:hypothetical protein